MAESSREAEFKGVAAGAPARGTDTSPSLAKPATTHHSSEVALVVCFLLLITSVPIAQTCLELARHERVQFTDVFRYRPTAANLRQYEATLREKSWFQQKLRPAVQRLLFTTLRDTGAKAILGRDQWLFYRPDVRYLLEPNRPEMDNSGSKWVQPLDDLTQRDHVVRAITRFHDQLKERGIALVVMPAPGKPGIYPDQVTRRAHAWDLHSPTLELLADLEGRGIATVNLFSIFQAARATNAALYLAQDTHWTPLGARLAAQAVAARLLELGASPPPAQQFRVRPIPVTRWGDVLEMMQIPGLREAFAPEKIECDQVFDPVLGPFVPAPSDRPGVYRYPGQKAEILVLGDSFCRIYQYPEPQSLGILPAGVGSGGTGKAEPVTKRLLPGSAGFVSHLALSLQSPVDAIYSDGGASTDVRRKLSTNPEILEGKKVVVWEFVERDIALGRQGWEEVPLPPKLD